VKNLQVDFFLGSPYHCPLVSWRRITWKNNCLVRMSELSIFQAGDSLVLGFFSILNSLEVQKVGSFVKLHCMRLKETHSSWASWPPKMQLWWSLLLFVSLSQSLWIS
jgi:hypothetical protein